MMMDRSGSMTRERRDVAKTFYFWMVQFLKRRYKKIELVFIAHDTQAYEVTEKEFFTISSSGGTKCSSAFKLALDLIKERHPPSKYNNYVFEFSDGDNTRSDNLKCYSHIKQLLPLSRAIGYGEIILDSDNGWVNTENTLYSFLDEKINRTRFVSARLTEKSDVFVALKRFFNIKKEEAK